MLPGVVKAEIPDILLNGSGRSYPLERAIKAAKAQWGQEGRPLPRSPHTTDDMPVRERLDRLERAMALLGEECPPQHDGRAVRSSALYDEWADLMSISGSELSARNIPVFQPHDGTTRSCLATSARVDGRRRPTFAIGSTSSRASGRSSSKPSQFHGGAPRALSSGRNG